MFSDKVRLYASFVAYIFPFAFSALRQKIAAILHHHSYKLLPASECKNVVVLGGSFAGIQLAKRLCNTLPTGYRVVLIEKNSHLNYLFTFPRFSVVKGYEEWAFIPYTGVATGAPQGIFTHVQGEAIEITGEEIVLKSGEKVSFAYLAIATGTSSGLPNKVASTEREGGMKELSDLQDKIHGAKRIAVVGGGAVGVELASDIKDVFAEAKGRGFDTKAMRHIIRLRKKDHAERQEEEAILELYMQALGM